jgi:hypothetical protein
MIIVFITGFFLALITAWRFFVDYKERALNPDGDLDDTALL